MTFPSQTQIDVIATNILVDAKQAILQLKGFNLSVNDSAERIKFLRELIKSTANQIGGDMKSATDVVAKFSKAFGADPTFIKSLGKELQLISEIAKQTGMSFDAAEKKFNGLALAIAEGTGDAMAFGAAVNASISSGLSLLTMMQVALIAISNQMDIIKGKASGSLGGGKSAVPMLGSGATGGGGGEGVIDADWSYVEDGAKKASGAVEDFGNKSKQAGEKGKNAFDRVFTSINALRIVLGAIISMVLFGVIQAFTQLYQDSIKQFTEMEDSLWRIVNVERELSKQGIEISVEGIKKGIEDIRKLLPIFSEQDISGLVGKVAISTKELGYSQQQILDLAKAIGILNVRSTENEDLNQTASKVITALLSGTTKGVSGLGVQLNDTAIKAKAVEMGLLKATDGLDKLNTESKNLVKLQIILDGTKGELGNISEYLDTNSAKLKENSAAWDDFKSSVGGFTSSIIPALSGVLEYLTGGVNAFKALLIVTETLKDTFFQILGAFANSKNAFDVVKNVVQALKDIPKSFDQNAAQWIPKLFAKMPTNAPDWFKNAFGKYLKDVETATDATGKFKDELAEDEDVLKALDAIDKGVQDIILDAKQAQEDLDIKKKQKEQDLDTEYQRKNEDAARDHAQKLEDINRDTQQKIADAKQKDREAEKKAEDDLLQKLKELRDRYLLDLEEALQKRDARQVLHLMREYEFDKQNLLDKKKLEDKQRADTLAQQLRDIELERRRRIDAENLEYQRKLADLALAKSREQAELQLWYKREQEDIQRNIQQKLEKLLAGYIAEEKIHESEQAKIYAILVKYFGKDAAIVDQMAQYMAGRFAQMQSMAAYTPAAVGSLNYQLNLPDKANPFAGTATVNLPSGATGSKSGSKGGRGMAEGGTIIADRPTSVMFGEKGLEAATFTPLGRSGSNVGNVFGDVSGGGINGQISVLVDLSPDLEARVVNKSMDGVANVVSRVNRRKQ